MYKLKELGTVIKSYSISRDKEVENNSLHYIHYGDIHTNKKENPSIKIDKSIDELELLKDGDIVFADASEDRKGIANSKVYRKTNDESTIAGLHTIAFRPNKDLINSDYLYYKTYTDDFKHYCYRMGVGTKVFGISKTNLLNYTFDLPSLQEQEKIGNFLSLMDKKIDLQKHKIELLKERKKGYIQKIFKQEIRFKDEHGQDYPDWEEKKLGEMVNYFNGASNEKNISEYGQYKLITLNSIGLNGNLKENNLYVSKKTKELYPNDLIMILSDVGNGELLGNTAIIPNDDNIYILNQRVGGLRIKNNTQCCALFLRYLINSEKKYFKICGQGMSQLNLNKSDVLNYMFLLPSLQEQEKIADFLSQQDEVIEKEEEKLALLIEQKKGLLQKLFV